MSEFLSFLRLHVLSIFEREKITLDVHFDRLLYLLTCHSKHCINTTCITRVSNVVPVRSSRVHFRAILRNTNTSVSIIMSDEENNSKDSFRLLL